LVCRIRFRKDGRMKFLSHLELQKAWDRALRREGVPLLFSSGYSPRPLMTFALPSAVGIRDHAGYMDVHVEDGFDVIRLMELTSLPCGLEVIGAKTVEETKTSLMSVVHSAEYILTGDIRALDRFKSDEPLEFVRINKRGRRHQRDARDYFLHAQWTENAVRVRLLAGSENSIRVNEFLEAITKDADAHIYYDVLRVEIYDREGRSLWEL